jgi:hypothetical protein
MQPKRSCIGSCYVRSFFPPHMRLPNLLVCRLSSYQRGYTHWIFRPSRATHTWGCHACYLGTPPDRPPFCSTQNQMTVTNENIHWLYLLVCYAFLPRRHTRLPSSQVCRPPGPSEIWTVLTIAPIHCFVGLSRTPRTCGCQVCQCAARQTHVLFSVL